MIGKISGRLEYRAADHVLIDVRGVGYVVHVSDRVMMALPPLGGAVALYTELLVREDLLQLFGFTTLVEKEWHRLLMGVQGVGAKASMAILGALGAEGVSRAIALGDWASIAKAKGVGPKTAQRVVMELKDKAPGVMAMGGTMAAAMGAEAAEAGEVIEAAAPTPRAPLPKLPASGMTQAEAMSALANLGYGPGDAAGAVARAAEGLPEAGTPELIRAALRLLAPKG
jgi:holliday junction DNA helicase RuvA